MVQKKSEEETGFTRSDGELPEGWKNEFAAQLERQEVLYSRLLELAREKRRILLAGPAGEEQARSLELIVQEETALIARSGALEQEYRALLEGLDGWNYKDMISCVPEGPERFQSLYRAVQELRQLNRENGEILKRFQRYVDFTVNLLEKRESGTYRETGTKKGTVKRVAFNQSRISRQV